MPKPNPNLRSTKLIGLLGRAGVGKTTVSNIIREEIPGTQLFSFADPIKELAELLFEFPHLALHGASELRNITHPEFANADRWARVYAAHEVHTRRWANRLTFSGSISNHNNSVDCLVSAIGRWLHTLEKEAQGVGITPRRVTQVIGTECGRAVDEDLWPTTCFNRSCMALLDYPCAVITDIRFINEAELLCYYGGEVWQIVRAETSDLEGILGEHSSEQDINSVAMRTLISKTIDNSSTLDETRKQIVEALKT